MTELPSALKRIPQGSLKGSAVDGPGHSGALDFSEPDHVEDVVAPERKLHGVGDVILREQVHLYETRFDRGIQIVDIRVALSDQVESGGERTVRIAGSNLIDPARQIRRLPATDAGLSRAETTMGSV